MFIPETNLVSKLFIIQDFSEDILNETQFSIQ